MCQLPTRIVWHRWSEKVLSAVHGKRIWEGLVQARLRTSFASLYVRCLSCTSTGPWKVMVLTRYASQGSSELKMA